jgi:hypothetical protein
MSCPRCSGCMFIDFEANPPKQIPCPNCGGSLLFIYPGDEEKEIRSAILLRSQMSFDFPKEK